MVLQASDKTLTLHVRNIVLVNYVLTIPTVLVSNNTGAPGYVTSNVPFVIMIANAAQVKCVAVYIFTIKSTALNLV